MWLLGVIVVAVVAIGIVVWWTQARARHEEPPELKPPNPELPERRDATWDPHERYDHGGSQPPAAEDPERDPE